MSNAIQHNLTFIPAQKLEENLSSALGSFGQTFKHQKLQELAARVQGYPSLNHRAAPKLARKGVTFLISELYCDAGTEFAELEACYLVVSWSWESFLAMKRAEAAAKFVDPWASVEFSSGAVDAYGMLEGDLDLDDPAAAAVHLEAVSRTEGSEDLYIRTECNAVHVAPALCSEVWVSGMERHGYPFSTPRIRLEDIERAFLTGEFDEQYEWHLLAPTPGELA